MRSSPGRGTPAERMVRLQLAARGITDPRVLDAMGAVRRDLFAPEAERAGAWEDRPVAIGHRQTMSQPYMVAFMTDALALRGGERVLEVGTGSGYQAAVLAEMGARVWSIERVPELAAAAARRLAELGYGGVRVSTGDGTEGWAEEAPFDRVIVTAAAPSLPAALCAQLADNGILVAPVGDRDGWQEITVARRIGGTLSESRSIGCRFVPLIGRGGFPA